MAAPPSQDQTSSKSHGSVSPHQHDEIPTVNEQKNEDAGAPRVKRRAPKACELCRKRKVRCDVASNGNPCTTCKVDRFECVIPDSKRKRYGSHMRDIASLSWMLTQTSGPRNRHNEFLTMPKTYSRIEPQNINDSKDKDTLTGQHVPHTIYQTLDVESSQKPFQVISHESVVYPVSNSPDEILIDPVPTDAFPIMNNEDYPAGPTTYIKPTSLELDACDNEYLEKKGAFTVPDDALRDEILIAYVKFVHPYMPILDLHSFLNIIEHSNSMHGQVSLLVLQAVIFAGSAFVDMQYLSAAGYATRKQARREFFTKTKLLYDFDYEDDRLCLVQALLLMTYNYETFDGQKDTWYWMGEVIEIAYSIGLHRNPENKGHNDNHVKLLKRIWWSIYMRERLISLGMRRPLRIKPEASDVPVLALEHFDLVALPSRFSFLSTSYSVVKDLKIQRHLAILCMWKIELCRCISLVLENNYRIGDYAPRPRNDKTMMLLVPKRDSKDDTGIRECDDLLEKWVGQLPQEAQYTTVPTGEDALDVQKSVLHMIFCATLSALHRAHIRDGVYCGPATANSSSSKVGRAARSTISIVQRLHAADLVKYLPITGVTALVPAILFHIFETKSQNNEPSADSSCGFNQGIAALSRLTEIYFAAEQSIAFLETMSKNAGVRFPRNMGDANTALPASSLLPTMTGSNNSGTMCQNSNSGAVSWQHKHGLQAPLQQQLISPELAKQFQDYLQAPVVQHEHSVQNQESHLGLNMENNSMHYENDPMDLGILIPQDPQDFTYAVPSFEQTDTRGFEEFERALDRWNDFSKIHPHFNYNWGTI